MGGKGDKEEGLADLKFNVGFPTRFLFNNLYYFFSNLLMRCALHINVLTVGAGIVARNSLERRGHP